MAATTNTSDAGKESGDAPTVEAPSKEQIDVVFASAIKAVESGEVESWITNGLTSVISTLWHAVHEFRKEGALVVESDKVEDVREEHLGGEQ